MPNRSGIPEKKGSHTFPIWQSAISLSPIAVAVGYIMAYLYELGYCGAFRIPSEFIQLQSTNIIATVGRVFLSFFFLFWVVFSLLLYVNDPKRRRLDPIRRRLLMIAFAILVYITFSFGYHRAFQEEVLSIGV